VHRPVNDTVLSPLAYYALPTRVVTADLLVARLLHQIERGRVRFYTRFLPEVNEKHAALRLASDSKSYKYPLNGVFCAPGNSPFAYPFPRLTSQPTCWY
jgi:hypothetical protein